MVKVTKSSGSGSPLHGFKSQLHMTFDESLDLSMPQFHYVQTMDNREPILSHCKDQTSQRM